MEMEKRAPMDMTLEKVPRLDILLYAHDGRGLGHASRTVAIGLALRRIYPELRVLVVTGCKITQELIGHAPLDWLKLPSYETQVVDGKSRGRDGNSNFTDKELGCLRGEELKNIFLLHRPRVVLCDHSPQGKHRELLPLLRTAKSFETHFVLGVRGVIGQVDQIKSSFFQDAIAYYGSVLWYGDGEILGSEHREQLKRYCNREPIECGYVSRLKELHNWQTVSSESAPVFAGTVSVPWLGEHTLKFLGCLAGALSRLGEGQQESWRLFIGCDAGEAEKVRVLFEELPHCILETPGSRYADALLQSKIAIIFGGYNSLMDILHLGIPSLVVLRGMADNEQQQHLQKLQEALGAQLAVCEEGMTTSEQLYHQIHRLTKENCQQSPVDLDGGEFAARYLYKVLKTLPGACFR